MVYGAKSKEEATYFNPLNVELNPTFHLLALLAHPILHISRMRVNGLVHEVNCITFLL
jgi:predicted metal-dependent peptidase